MVTEILIIFGITIVLSFVIGWVMRRSQGAFKGNTIAREFFQNAFLPVQLLIWGYGLFMILTSVSTEYQFYITPDGIFRLRKIYTVLMVGWILFRSKAIIETSIFRFFSSKQLISDDQTVFLTASRIITLILFVILSMILLDIVGVPLSALLAFGGVGGLALSLAARDFIANFFGGMIIFVNRHFSVGDWIKSPNKNFEGFVEEIGWYMTRIRTFERRPMYIPNALITDAIIENPGRMYARRIRTTIGLRYSDMKRVKPISEEIEAMLKSHPEVDKSQIINVRFTGFGEHSINIDIYCFTSKKKLVDFRDVYQSIMFAVADIIERNGAEMAYPTSRVILSKEGEDV